MSSEPLVCAVMLANGRQEMVNRAVASWKAQTYERKMLLIYDTTPEPLQIAGGECVFHYIGLPGEGQPGNRPIGALRNEANAKAQELGADIIVHWDSDDWSAPERIEQQVEELQNSEALLVGYTQMLFWKEPVLGAPPYPGHDEAWLYTSRHPQIVLGTSF